MFKKSKPVIKKAGWWDFFKHLLPWDNFYTDVKSPETETTRLVREIGQAEIALSKNEPGAEFQLRRLRAELQKQPGLQRCVEAPADMHERWLENQVTMRVRGDAWRRNCGHGPRP